MFFPARSIRRVIRIALLSPLLVGGQLALAQTFGNTDDRSLDLIAALKAGRVKPGEDRFLSVMAGRRPGHPGRA